MYSQEIQHVCCCWWAGGNDVVVANKHDFCISSNLLILYLIQFHKKHTFWFNKIPLNTLTAYQNPLVILHYPLTLPTFTIFISFQSFLSTIYQPNTSRITRTSAFKLYKKTYKIPIKLFLKPHKQIFCDLWTTKNPYPL